MDEVRRAHIADTLQTIFDELYVGNPPADIYQRLHTARDRLDELIAYIDNGKDTHVRPA